MARQASRWAPTQLDDAGLSSQLRPHCHGLLQVNIKVVPQPSLPAAGLVSQAWNPYMLPAARETGVGDWERGANSLTRASHVK